ncbi:hypothetical protein [Oricola sp.]|uniref:hypothetical protein n=1 Tax=Oricola sp. TaxID=1979950 RepID=UPI003BAD0E6A
MSGFNRFNRFKGAVDNNTRLFPADLVSRPGRGVWFKLANWQADGRGRIDPGSRRRGRLTKSFRVTAFFNRHMSVE